MNPYQGLKLVKQSQMNYSLLVTMPMNPYQGLKQWGDRGHGQSHPGHNANESLSGIETERGN